MAAVERLVTFVDIRADASDDRLSVSARHEAVLVDGRRVLLLDDRGWSSSARTVRWGDTSPGVSAHEDIPDVWAVTSIEDIEEETRVVVGPDEPFGGRSQEDMEAEHWDYLAGILGEQGVIVDAHELRRLPHDVVLSERLRARAGRGA